MTDIIGLVGRAGSGKDTAAAHLAQYGFRRVALADPVREMALDINPLVDEEVWLVDAVTNLGWEGAKRTYPEVRRFLQRLGTDGVRKHISDSWWIDTGIDRALLLDRAVFTDVRFQNEADQIIWNGGWLVRIDRPGVEPLDAVDHASEAEIDRIVCDHIIHAPDLSALYAGLDDLMGRLGFVKGAPRADLAS